MAQDNFGDNPSAPPSGKRYVLAIGINDYGPGSGLPSLKYPERDARKLIEILCDEYGFESVPLSQKNQDGFRQSLEELSASIKQIKNQVEECSVVVFFAGHGDGKYWHLENGSKMSIVETITLLLDLKAQVLLIADCCFAGGASERASHDALFAKVKNPETFFYVLTSSNDAPTKDKSDFFEYLTQILQEEEIEYFGELSSILQNKFKAITFFDADTAPNELFLLRRYDPNKPRLRKALYDIVDITNESSKLRHLGPRTVTLLYLHGSPHCAHHLFVRYLFNHLRTEKQAFSLIPTMLKLGQMEAQRAKRIWNLFTSKKGQGDFWTLEDLDRAEDRVFFLKIGDNFEEQNHELLQKDLLDFWVSLNTPLLIERLKSLDSSRFYFIILDERGIKGKIDDAQFEGPSLNARSFVWIQSLKPDLLMDWQSQKTTGDEEITAERFKSEAFEDLIKRFAETDFFIANTIKKIAGHCGYPKLADEILLNQTS